MTARSLAMAALHLKESILPSSRSHSHPNSDSHSPLDSQPCSRSRAKSSSSSNTLGSKAEIDSQVSSPVTGESTVPEGSTTKETVPMIRVGGKSWKSQKTATKRSNLSASRKTPYEQRRAAAQLAKEIKQQEEEMKEERQQELEHRKKKIQERRQKKAEKERFELLQAKMHQKSVDRIKRRAKKSKLING